MAGIKVTSVDTKTEALHHLAKGSFELLLIGHLVPVQARNEVALKAKAQKMRVIFLYHGSIAQAEPADAILTAEVTAEDLIATAFRLATADEGPRARQVNE
ncbi:MAG TPA: hypothetical protein VFR24_19155 [Candidatus Angelobacter sp.]|nr:hypothetical protein [Candidatus Angelobacter sp.]